MNHHVRHLASSLLDRLQRNRHLFSSQSQLPLNARRAAVLILIRQQHDNMATVVLTRRHSGMRAHPGQVVLPGGKVEGDELPREAALREAKEEIGVDSRNVDVLGSGAPLYILPSRFWVEPVVAVEHTATRLTAQPGEVEEILEVPLHQLLEPERWRCVVLPPDRPTWAWQLDSFLLWGGTATMLASFLDTALPHWHGGADPARFSDELTLRPWEHDPAWTRPVRFSPELRSVPQEAVPHLDEEQYQSLWQLITTGQAGLHEEAVTTAAGHRLADVLARLRRERGTHAPVVVLVGPGMNGLAGTVTATTLADAGIPVRILTLGRSRDDPAVAAARLAGATVAGLDPDRSHLPHGAIVTDAVLGIADRASHRVDLGELSGWIRQFVTTVVSLDQPSGLSPSQGLVDHNTVAADITVALGAPSKGASYMTADPFVGDLCLADIGIPESLWAQVLGDDQAAAMSELFDQGPLIRLAAQDPTLAGPRSTQGCERGDT